MKQHVSLALLALSLTVSLGRAEDWPQWLGPRRDSVWKETGLLEKFPEGGPKILWRVPVQYGYAGPAVAKGRVYVTDYATNDKVVAGFARSKLSGKERVLCLDAGTGQEVWKVEYECKYALSYAGGPRCTPTVHDGRVYVLGAMGHLLCLDTATGKELWKHDLAAEYKMKEVPIWGFCGHPVVDGDRLYCLVGGKGSVAVAFDRITGKEVWRALSAKEPGYCPPTFIEAGGTKQLIIWHAEAINSLDPATGKVHWSVPLEPAYGMSIAAPRQLGDYLFASGIGDKGVMLRLGKNSPTAEVVWKGEAKTGLYSANCTPFLEEGIIYGCCVMQGQMRAVKVETGERLWETFAPTTGGKTAPHGTAFIVKNANRFFLMSETGHLLIARLTPQGYEEISRAKLLEPTGNTFGRNLVWSHPAFAQRCVFARNDKELVCASLAP